jgi:hypothetical protein
MTLQVRDHDKVLEPYRPYASLRDPLTQVGALLDAAALQPSRTARNHLPWLAHSQGLGARRVDEVIALAGLQTAPRRRPCWSAPVRPWPSPAPTRSRFPGLPAERVVVLLSEGSFPFAEVTFTVTASPPGV